jgi:hypothetical protein
MRKNIIFNFPFIFGRKLIFHKQLKPLKMKLLTALILLIMGKVYYQHKLGNWYKIFDINVTYGNNLGWSGTIKTTFLLIIQMVLVGMFSCYY